MQSWWAFWRWFGAGSADRSAPARFAAERPGLQAAFLRVASASGKPRGLRWKSIDWQPGALFARDRDSGALVALVGITIGFEAIPGSDMEGVAAVGNLRHASAVFHCERGQWRTGGRAVFNLAPDEVLVHFNHQYEALEPPSADSR